MLFIKIGGPKIIPLRYIINAFKGLTFLWVIFLMLYFQNFSKGMYVYLFMHGTYGFLWIYKDLNFPDASMKPKSTLVSNILLTTLLFIYWMIPVPLAAGFGVSDPPLIRIALEMILYFGGLYLMLRSDYQKAKTL